MGNNGKRRTRRVALTAQLVPGRDDDLIAWLNAIESGNRAGAIKSALRIGLGLPLQGDPPPAPADPTVATSAEIDQLREELDTWSSQVLDYFDQRLVQLLNERIAAGNVPAAAVHVAGDGQRIDESRKKKRDQRLKAAQW